MKVPDHIRQAKLVRDPRVATAGGNGKGDTPRPVDGETYRKNWEGINWKNKSSLTKDQKNKIKETLNDLAKELNRQKKQKNNGEENV